jgi:hypothetical protein
MALCYFFSAEVGETLPGSSPSIASYNNTQHSANNAITMLFSLLPVDSLASLTVLFSDDVS